MAANTIIIIQETLLNAIKIIGSTLRIIKKETCLIVLRTTETIRRSIKIIELTIRVNLEVKT